MIKSFKGCDTERLFNDERVGKFQEVERTARRKLLMLHAARELRDLRVPPNNKLEKLKDDREGQYSIRISDKWRICFAWKDGDAFEVEITDYH